MVVEVGHHEVIPLLLVGIVRHDGQPDITNHVCVRAVIERGYFVWIPAVECFDVVAIRSLDLTENCSLFISY